MGSSTSATHQPFFVYGTLLPQQPNAHLWAPYAAATRPALLQGARLHDLGHYPMLVETDDSAAVHGVLLTIEPAHFDDVVRLLDRLERYNPARPDAGLYRRRRRPVLPAGGDSLNAWVYVGRLEVVQGHPLVPNGDWAAYTQGRRREMARWWRANGGDYDSPLRPDALD